MRIGELARQVGVSTDTVRFYERSGWLPRAARRDNDYRDYGEPDVEHLRLLLLGRDVHEERKCWVASEVRKFAHFSPVCRKSVNPESWR